MLWYPGRIIEHQGRKFIIFGPWGHKSDPTMRQVDDPATWLDEWDQNGRKPVKL